MRGTFCTIFLLFGFLSQHVTASEPNTIVGNDEPTEASAAKSILYGAILGSIVAAAASVASSKNSTYLFASLITAGSAGGLGHYLLLSAGPPTKVSPSVGGSEIHVRQLSPSTLGVTANVFSWNF